MIDTPGWLDPLLAAGPRLPQDVLRPQVSEQRILLLDGPNPEMVDLATGNIRRWENGPPLTLPCVSAPFDLGQYRRLLVQVIRDLRPASVDLVLLSLAVGDDTVEVVERRGGVLSIVHDGTSTDGAIGSSSAIVTEFTIGEEGSVQVAVRNAESATGHQVDVHLPVGPAILTLGGPSTQVSGVVGRRRLGAIHLDVTVRREPADQVKRAARVARRAADAIRGRVT